MNILLAPQDLSANIFYNFFTTPQTLYSRAHPEWVNWRRIRALPQAACTGTALPPAPDRTRPFCMGV
jgi:hypothetical protein